VRLIFAPYSLFMNRSINALIILSLLASCNNSSQKEAQAGGSDKTADNTPPLINYTVVRTLPHDTSSFTEGLLVHDGRLYESTGTEPDMPASRRSLFGIVDTITGKISPKAELDRKIYFGEGISFLHDKVYQLTWKTKKGFIYDAKTFKRTGEFPIPIKEGWGMTTDGTNLIMSDGTSNISYVDPSTFRLVKVVGVTDNNGPVSNINELELINGFLYANQWESNYILKIDSSSGKVVGKLDLDSIVNDARTKYKEVDVLNGIAYDPASGKIYITGKLWRNIYEIKFPI